MKGYEVLDEVLGITDVVEKSTEVVSKEPKKNITNLNVSRLIFFGYKVVSNNFYYIFYLF